LFLCEFLLHSFTSHSYVLLVHPSSSSFDNILKKHDMIRIQGWCVRAWYFLHAHMCQRKLLEKQSILDTLIFLLWVWCISLSTSLDLSIGVGDCAPLQNPTPHICNNNPLTQKKWTFCDLNVARTKILT